MKISIAYALPEKQVWRELSVENGCTVQQAIETSEILKLFPDINLSEQKIGIFGKFCKLEAILKEGDRIEIYRTITADPKTVKRRDTDDSDD